MTTRQKPTSALHRNRRERAEIEPKQESQPGLQSGYDKDGHRINHNGHRVTKHIHPDGESGRRWMHPWHFLRVCWKSSCTASKWVNVLWPFVPAAIAVHFALPHRPNVKFSLAYVGMVPAANLLGFAGQELARKLPKVFGVILETTFGSMVEIILFTAILVIRKEQGVPVVRAAILGSILANLLLCLGVCFFAGGFNRHEQTFHDAVSDTGSNLMLVAGMGLVIPTIFYSSLQQRFASENNINALTHDTELLSRATAIVLLLAFVVYVFFQTRSHHGLFEDILEGDEQRDNDRERDLLKPKLTFTESIIAIILAIAFVSLMAVFLVVEIEAIIQPDGGGVSDAFLGLILIPLVEKFAEHLTAIDEAYDDQMNFALSHILGATIQTALLNTPLIVFVGWGLHYGMSLNFDTFDAVVLILAILVVSSFLRDGKSNYLEGSLCVLVYVLIAVSAYFYPNPIHPSENAGTAHAGER